MTAPTQRLSSLTINCGGREPINIISTGDEHFLRSATSSSPSPLEMSGKARRLSKTWSRQDDDLLVDNRNRGLNWKQIKEHFPNKTANACRKHCERVIKDRKRSEDWDSAKIERLARRYCEQRREIWEGLAEPEDDWEIAEFKCLSEKGLKFIISLGQRMIKRDSDGQAKSAEEKTLLDDSGIGGSILGVSEDSSAPSTADNSPADDGKRIKRNRVWEDDDDSPLQSRPRSSDPDRTAS